MEQLQQIATQLGIDQTFYYTFATLVVLYLLFSIVYLKPYQNLLRLRRERTEGARKAAQELFAKAEEKSNQYRTRLKSVHDQARSVFKTLEEAAKSEEQKILGEASQKAKNLLQNAQKELDGQRQSLLENLSKDVAGIAQEIASKVLGRAVDRH